MLTLDELDTMDWEIMGAAMLQPLEKNNIPSFLLMLSTYHVVGGTMAKILGDAVEASTDLDEDDEAIDTKVIADSFSVFKYCIWEILESCKDYSCSTCKLSAVCPGMHMKDAVGYYTVSDLVKKMESITKSRFETELLCLRPSRRGLIFDPAI